MDTQSHKPCNPLLSPCSRCVPHLFSLPGGSPTLVRSRVSHPVHWILPVWNMLLNVPCRILSRIASPHSSMAGSFSSPLSVAPCLKTEGGVKNWDTDIGKVSPVLYLMHSGTFGSLLGHCAMHLSINRVWLVGAGKPSKAQFQKCLLIHVVSFFTIFTDRKDVRLIA